MSSVEELMSEQRLKLSQIQMQKELEKQIEKEGFMQQLTKIKLRDLYQQRMLETSKVVNEFDQTEIIRWKNRVTLLEDENSGLLSTLNLKNEKIKRMEDQIEILKEKAQNYEEIKG